MRTRTCLKAIQGLAIVGMLIQFACGGASTKPEVKQAVTPATPVTVTLDAPSNVTPGGTISLKAQVVGTTNTAVTWTVNNIPNGNATVGTINGSGANVTYTAPTTAGGYVLGVSSVSDPTKSDTAQVTVFASASISSVTVGPTSWTLNAGTQKQFDATVSGTGTYSSAVTWSAQRGSVTSTGLYTAPATGGSDVVTAKSVQDTSKSASSAVTVVGSSTITSVLLTPATLTLNVNATSQFNPTVTGTGGFNGAVTWSAQRGAITASGLYTAPATSGGDVVTAKSVQDASKTATATITVSSPTPVPPTITGVAISPTAWTLTGGAQKQFSAVVSGTGNFNTSVTWTAQHGSIDSTGLYTAPASGSDVVTASAIGSALSAAAAVTVNAIGSSTYPGFGYQTTGGQGKPTVHVTNLNDSGPGSFRAALGSNRTIVFDVGGTIALTSENINESGLTNLSIDGTSAPGPGITFTQRGMWFRNSSNIIVKNIRHRGGYDAGPETGPNINFFPNCTNVVLDHCSFSGFNDSAINLWSNIHEVTIVDCIVGPGTVANHNFLVLISEKCYNVTMLHNLMYGGDYRNPAVGWADNDNPDYPQAAPGLVADVVNNVVYKYGGYGTSIYWGAKANVVGNWYWSDSGGTAFEYGDPHNLAQAHCSGNFHKGSSAPSGNVGTAFSVPSAAKVTAMDAASAANYVKANAGCRVGGLDATDQAMINDLIF